MLRTFQMQLLLLICFTFIYPTACYSSNFNIDSIETILEKTKFNFNEILSLKNIDKFEFNIVTWHLTKNDNTSCPYFPDEFKKNQIRNTTSIMATINFTNELICKMQLANFQNLKDASLGLRDVLSYGKPPDLTTLFSGELLDKTKVQIRLFNNYAIIHLLFKNCVCVLIFSNKTKLLNSDFETIDNFVKTVRNVINQSVKSK